MLSGLILENFKAFGERQLIPLAPITLVFGVNSAGKSSVIQSLLMLKQTLFVSRLSFSLFDLNGQFVDLGSFHDLVFKNEQSTRKVEVTPLLGSAGSYTRNWLKGETGKEFGIGFKSSFDDDRKAGILYSIPIYLGSTNIPALSLFPERGSEKTTKSPETSGTPGHVRMNHIEIDVNTNWN